MTRTRTILLPLFAMSVLLMVLCLVGCSFAFEVGKDKNKQQATTVPANVPQARTIAEIPNDAKLIGQGNQNISFTTDQPGTIYVFSRDDRQVSLQYDLVAGETFAIQPIPDDGTKFTADRHTSAGSGTIPASPGGYEVYFQPKGLTTTSPAEMAPGA